jgi:hypothetical protein
MSKLEKGGYPGLEIIGKLAVVLEVWRLSQLSCFGSRPKE